MFMSNDKLAFPDDFLFGTATSAYQIEGHNYNNDWYEFEQDPINIPEGEKAGVAVDHWNRYNEDFDLMEKLNVNSYRMSIEWSRIYPKEGKIDQNALDQYEMMVKTLIKRNIRVMLNLHHFTVPLWFSKKGGFEDKENNHYFEEYTGTIIQRFGESVDLWCTINEPMVVAVSGYLNGEFPPRKSSLVLALKVGRNLLRIHASAYNIIKERFPNSLVGFVKHIPVFQQLTDSWSDRIRAKYADYMYTRSIFSSIKTGKLLFNPFIKIPHLKNASDYIGINYYSRMLASKKHFPTIYHGAPPNADPEYLCTGLGWEPYPQGLFMVLKRMSKMFPDKPLFVAENGIGTDNDEWRQYNLISHLLEIKRALKEGINIMGYHYWSLLDNYEWTQGFTPRFGLIHVDYKTQNRTIKESGNLYSKICKTKSILHSDIQRSIDRFPKINKSMRLRWK